MTFYELKQILNGMRDDRVPFNDGNLNSLIYCGQANITDHGHGDVTAIVHPRGTVLYARVHLKAEEMAYYVSSVEEEPKNSLHECGWQSGHPGLY